MAPSATTASAPASRRATNDPPRSPCTYHLVGLGSLNKVPCHTHSSPRELHEVGEELSEMLFRSLCHGVSGARGKGPTSGAAAKQRADSNTTGLEENNRLAASMFAGVLRQKLLIQVVTQVRQDQMTAKMFLQLKIP